MPLSCDGIAERPPSTAAVLPLEVWRYVRFRLRASEGWSPAGARPPETIPSLPFAATGASFLGTIALWQFSRVGVILDSGDVHGLGPDEIPELVPGWPAVMDDVEIRGNCCCVNRMLVTPHEVASKILVAECARCPFGFKLNGRRHLETLGPSSVEGVMGAQHVGLGLLNHDASDLSWMCCFEFRFGASGGRQIGAINLSPSSQGSLRLGLRSCCPASHWFSGIE